MPRRGFGTVNALPSGRYRARYVGPDLVRYSAAVTYTTKAAAEGWLTDEWRLIERGEWQAPALRRPHDADGTPAGKITLRTYAERWLAQSRTRETTRALYGRLLRLDILPVLGDKPIPSIGKPEVAAWWRGLDHSRRRTCDLAYALLRTIMRTAVDDGLIEVSPCQVRGAGVSSRRRVVDPLTPAQVQAVADAIVPARWRLGVLLGAWCGLRSGEIRELRRRDIDVTAATVTIARAVVRVHGADVVADPKTDAGRRTVAIPAPLIGDVKAHLRDHAQIGPDGLLFWSSSGGHVGTTAWLQAFKRACAAAGLDGDHLRFHDLRHVGLTYLAAAGATVRELQHVAGHTTPAMAMRYQEVAQDHLAGVVDRLGDLIAAGRAG